MPCRIQVGITYHSYTFSSLASPLFSVQLGTFDGERWQGNFACTPNDPKFSTLLPPAGATRSDLTARTLCPLVTLSLHKQASTTPSMPNLPNCDLMRSMTCEHRADALGYSPSALKRPLFALDQIMVLALGLNATQMVFVIWSSKAVQEEQKIMTTAPPKNIAALGCLTVTSLVACNPYPTLSRVSRAMAQFNYREICNIQEFMRSIPLSSYPTIT
ncbi:uncharacterized protein BT62DRAFT_1078856 [Guyanagaster necrorhizus]|uniref:Uncharacterized protein n=1 Tax=Guyanagaster necrorhizus TaxID=856835 RepID=A0A9P7VMP2_9AGAR|nr:uncharacterized protein BT62DRAFT_1078856 [Guyanagaster necrorhizus MCA 3950]KAG7443130.1 hypothetical protein BT62DRAFT_1078856 [Guyanagaster necrorhizus MCA 3950]